MSIRFLAPCFQHVIKFAANITLSNLSWNFALLFLHDNSSTTSAIEQRLAQWLNLVAVFVDIALFTAQLDRRTAP